MFRTQIQKRCTEMWNYQHHFTTRPHSTSNPILRIWKKLFKIASFISSRNTTDEIVKVFPPFIANHTVYRKLLAGNWKKWTISSISIPFESSIGRFSGVRSTLFSLQMGHSKCFCIPQLDCKCASPLLFNCQMV